MVNTFRLFRLAAGRAEHPPPTGTFEWRRAKADREM